MIKLFYFYLYFSLSFPGQDKPDSSSVLSSSCSGVISAYHNRDLDRNSDNEIGLIESSIPEHVSNLHAEDDWILAPPPIFIANRRVLNTADEADPLENLLIEHPSMSVYNSTSTRRSRPTNVLQRSALENTQPSQVANGYQRHASHVLAGRKISADMHAIMKGQACERKNAMQSLNRNKIERANKIHNRSNIKILRRKSRLALAPSGCNNNRKC